MENLIRKILREIFTEVIATQHYNDRSEVGGRLSDAEYSTFDKEAQRIKDIVYENLDYIQDVEFPEDISVAVLVLRSKTEYFYTKPGAVSRGKNVWVVIRDNNMTTLMFSNADTVIGKEKIRTDYAINVEKLRDYIDKEKDGDKNLTEKDLKEISKPKVVIVDDEKEEKTEKVIKLGGVNYVVDGENEKIFKKNNPSQSYELLSFVSNLEPNDQERIYNLLEAYES